MAVSEQSVLSLEYNQAPEVEVVVASNISLTDLKEITAETLNISQPVTLEYFDDDFDEWVAVDEEYQLPRQGKLRVTITHSAVSDADHNADAETPEWDLYCTDPELPDSGENPENASGHPQGVAGGWGPTSKVWGRHDVLSVYFHNPDILKRWKCGDSTMDVNGILGWAGEWNSKTPHVPTFERIDSSKRAHIRVTFEETRCWSKIGTDAKKVKDKAKPTMALYLNNLHPDTQKSLVIQQFGHSLGLEYEHQRSDFWHIIKKHINLEKMKEDPRVKGKFDEEWYKKKGGSEMTKYDSESIMHFWFDIEWFKNKKYRSEDYIEQEPRAHLSAEEKEVLKGIVKRRNNRHKLAKRPSGSDLEYLEKAYAKVS